MHHELFTNQKRLGPELYQELAKGQKLDAQQYLACLKDPAQTKSVEADLAYEPGDVVVATVGVGGATGTTNTIRVVTVET